MNATRILQGVAVAFLVVNYADFATTYIAVTSGKGVETNPIVVAIGGPLSLPSITMKLVIIPWIIIGATWWGTRKAPRLTVAAILPSAVGIGVAVANNVIVITKKVMKIVEKKEEEKTIER